MARKLINTLVTKKGKELAKWEGSGIPKELRKSVKQNEKMGGKVVTEWL